MPNLGKSLLALSSGGTQGYTAAHERRLDRERQETLDLQSAGRNDLLNQLTRLQIEGGRKELDAPPVPRKPIPIGPYGAIGPGGEIIGGKGAGEGAGGLGGADLLELALKVQQRAGVDPITGAPLLSTEESLAKVLSMLGVGGGEPKAGLGAPEDPNKVPDKDPGEGKRWQYYDKAGKWGIVDIPLAELPPLEGEVSFLPQGLGVESQIDPATGRPLLPPVSRPLTPSSPGAARPSILGGLLPPPDPRAGRR